MTTTETKPDAISIIERSITLHPTLFVEVLQSRADEDARFAASREAAEVKRAVGASAAAARRAILAVRLNTSASRAEAFKDDMSAGIIALNIACKLQCLPAHIRTSAALETWESNL